MSKVKTTTKKLKVKKLRGVIFDFNGVIVDDYPLQKQAWTLISQKLRGKPVNDKEMVEKIRGVRTAEIVCWLAKKRLSKKEVIKYAREKEALIKKLYRNSPRFKLNRGLEEILDEFSKQGIVKTIATSSSVEMARFSFKRLNLKRWFRFKDIVYNDGKHKGKPEPDPYLLAAQRLGLKPSECIVFEDAKSGIMSAYRAGIGRIIAVGSEDRLEKMRMLPGVTKTIHDFTEIEVANLFN